MIARCFIALELGETALEAVAEAQGLLDGDLVRKVAVDALHVTVKFLGDVSIEEVAQPLFETLAALVVATPAPPLGEARLDGFPAPGRANVVVLSCSDPELRVAGLAARAGLDEERAFHPHITVARGKGVDVRKLVKRYGARPLGLPTRLTLFQSDKTVYTPLASVAYSASK